MSEVAGYQDIVYPFAKGYQQIIYYPTTYKVIIKMQPRKVINFVPYVLQKLISKNFSEEIRAAKDVEIFLERPTLLLGVHETSLQGIVDKMLEKLISVIGGEDIDFEDARMAFFTHDSGKANQVSEWLFLRKLGCGYKYRFINSVAYVVCCNFSA